MAKEKTKKAKAEEEYEEEEEESTEEESADEEEEADEPEEEEEEDDFKARAKKSAKKVKGKKADEEEEEDEKPAKKGKVTKMKKAAKKSTGRAEWDTPWRPASALAEAFKMAQKGTTIKELTVLAKKADAQPSYVIGALKREDFRGWTWKTKGDGKSFKVFNVVQGKAKKAA